MNARAIQLVGRARGLIALYPGAVSIQCNDSRKWTSVIIGTATDDAVFQLALLLELNPPNRAAQTARQSWTEAEPDNGRPRRLSSDNARIDRGRA